MRAPQLDQLVKVEGVPREFSYREDRALQGKGRDDGVDAGPVLQARVHHGHALVDTPAQGTHDALDDPEKRILARKGAVGHVELASDLDEDLVLSVDHDLRDFLVLDQVLDRSEPEYLVEHLLVEVLPIHVIRDRVPHGIHNAPDGAAGRTPELFILDALQVHPTEVQKGDQSPVDLLLDRNQALVVAVFGRLEDVPVELLRGRLLARRIRDDAQVVAAQGNRVRFLQGLASPDANPVDERAGPALQVDHLGTPVLEAQLEVSPGQGRLVQDDVIRGRGPDEDLVLPDIVLGCRTVLTVADVEAHSLQPFLSRDSIKHVALHLLPDRIVSPLHVIQDLQVLLRLGAHETRGKEDHQLGIPVGEVPGLEQLSQDGEVPDHGHLVHGLCVLLIHEPGEDENLVLVQGDVGVHASGLQARVAVHLDREIE